MPNIPVELELADMSRPTRFMQRLSELSQTMRVCEAVLSRDLQSSWIPYPRQAREFTVGLIKELHGYARWLDREIKKLERISNLPSLKVELQRWLEGAALPSRMPVVDWMFSIEGREAYRELKSDSFQWYLNKGWQWDTVKLAVEGIGAAIQEVREWILVLPDEPESEPQASATSFHAARDWVNTRVTAHGRFFVLEGPEPESEPELEPGSEPQPEPQVPESTLTRPHALAP